MSKKKGFVVYNDWCDIFEPLSFEEKGMLINSVFDFVNKGVEPEFTDSGLKISFNVIRNALKRDAVKYDEKCIRNAENARKRWEARQKFATKTENEKETKSMQSHTNECERIRMDANYADIDKDKDTDTERDKDTDTERDKEIKTNIKSSSFSKKTACVYSDDFLAFWKVYPKKTGKGEAYKQWKKQGITSDELQEILNALKWQKNASQWLLSGGRYIPYPSTYISQRRWEDEPSEDSGGDITDPERYKEGDVLPDYIMRGDY